MKAFFQEIETLVNGLPGQSPFECTGEGKLYQRYEKNLKYLNNQVNNFNKIKSRFQECNDDTLEEIHEKVQKLSEKVPPQF